MTHPSIEQETMYPHERFLPGVCAVALCAGPSGAALALQPDANDVAEAKGARRGSSKGTGWPQWQVFVGFNAVFK